MTMTAPLSAAKAAAPSCAPMAFASRIVEAAQRLLPELGQGHRLTPAQTTIYDAYSRAFQVIHNNLSAALEASNITSSSGTLNGRAKSAARLAFESAKQRFFIWDTLDKVRAKHPDMVLIHGGSPKGAERIAACWADNRNVPQIVFRPDWTRHRNAAPFKRNDQMLETLPIGVIAFPGSGISRNLADKARRMGVPVWSVHEGGA